MNDPIRDIFARRTRPMTRRGALRAAGCGMGYLGLASVLAQAATTMSSRLSAGVTA